MVPKKILVVEDDQFYSSIFERKLKAEGYDVVVTSDGEKGLAAARELKPDLILLDMVMPVKDGYETLKDLRQDDTLKGVKVVILSNLGQDADIETTKQYHVADYIVKANMSLEEMVQTVRKVLS